LLNGIEDIVGFSVVESWTVFNAEIDKFFAARYWSTERSDSERTPTVAARQGKFDEVMHILGPASCVHCFATPWMGRERRGTKKGGGDLMARSSRVYSQQHVARCTCCWL